MSTAKAGLRYVVVTRDRHLPIQHFATIEAAADKIVRERALATWTVLAQEGLTASAKMRQLTLAERKKLEKAMFPSLFD